MSAPLESIGHLLVTPENPPRDIDGMDHERCAALHNAIFQHGWVSSGRDVDDFVSQSRPWLDFNPQAGQYGLHHSVLAFLRDARALPLNHQVHFFYNVWGLNCALGGQCHEYCFPESDQTLTLYGTYPELASIPDGLIYDQSTHKAIMHFDVTDELTPEQPWQKLESILTVWIEMIRRQKVVALPANVGTTSHENAAGGGVRVIEGPKWDPATGAKRLDPAMEPWTMVPWAKKDLEESLEVWGMAVDSIEQKMGLGRAARSDSLLDVVTVNAAHIPDGFAREFLTKARRPRFEFIAPGLQVPTAGDFIGQPFIDGSHGSEDEDKLPAILLFRNDSTVSTNGLFWFGFPPDTPTAQCPCGLYLNPCERSYRYPQEDGCTLILPFEFTSGRARQSDFTAVDHCDKLLQAGVNPYNDVHPTQLQAFLETVYLNVERGHWAVDEHGVAGGIDVWKDADTEQSWSNYFVPLGPGRYW
ncbi:hypothetical protein LTR36_005264 [Oleoguttula mirabilis]|uniref:Uncharacterized protein n=1 Tax=Oleoguttula mirabilis TaxID=1507867 RepID=A0AAV9JEG5_9PEZI|nr:hypothetical protein LTR36_005264 [Oleoguttula mirabilis]